ncbi:MAG: hypothetical protein ACRDJJ_02740 [Actinomycetota bacterium]
MARIVLLLPQRGRRVDLGPDAAGALADLGVTHAAFLQDGQTIAVVLEGTSFEPGRSGRLAADLVGGPEALPRLLHPIAELELVPNTTEGRTT